MTTADVVGHRSFAADLRAEFVRLLRSPRIELSIIAFNLAVVCLGWVILPAFLKDWLFSNLQGHLAFVIVLETWLMGDVTSTNLFAHDSLGAIDALERRDGVRRLVRVKIAALALVIGPLCAAIAIVTGLRNGQAGMPLLLTPAILAVPFAAPAVASWLGVVFPYRPRSLLWRWQHRRRWFASVRWAVLVLVPYTLVSALLAGLVVPSKLAADLLTGFHGHGRPPMPTVAVMVAVLCGVSISVFVVAPRISDRLAQARRGRLIAYFGDPEAA